MTEKNRNNSLIGHVFLLLLLGICLYFTNLGSYPLFDEDEPRFASAGREMIERGSYIVPYFNQKPRLNKPILFYWFEIASYKVFGVNEFAARFWSAVFAIGLIILTYVVCRKFFRPKAGLWAAFALATSWLMLWLGRAAMTDSMLTFFITACIFTFYLGFKGKRSAYFLCYIAGALAVLQKGPVGVFLPAAAIIPFLIHVRGLKKCLREGYVFPGILIFLAIVLPWYVAILKATNGLYLKSFLFGENVGRYTATVGGHGGDWWYFLAVVIGLFFPWSLMLIPSFGSLKLKEASSQDSSEQLLLLCGWWAITTIGFFSLSATKLVHYILPAFPALSVLVGAYIAEPKPVKPGSRIMVKIADILIVVLSFLFAAFFIYGLPKILDANKNYLVAPGESINLGWGTYAIGAALAASGIFYTAMIIRKNRSAAAYILLAAMVAADILFITAIFPMASKYYSEPPRDLARLAAKELGQSGRIISYDWKTSSNLVFYSQRKVIYIRAEELDLLRQELKKPGPIALLTKVKNKDNPIFNNFRVSSQKGAFVLLVR